MHALVPKTSQNHTNAAFQYHFKRSLQRANAFVTVFLRPNFAAKVTVQRNKQQMENNYRGL